MAICVDGAPDASGYVLPPGQLPASYTDQLDRKSAPQLFPSFDLSAPGLGEATPHWSRRLGWLESSSFRPWPLPTFALATADGRAVVILDEVQGFTWTAISATAVLPKYWSDAANAYAAPPPVYWRYADVKSARKGLKVTLDDLLSYLAVDPPPRFHGIGLPYNGGTFSTLNATKSYGG
jgi:hypothetical protein